MKSILILLLIFIVSCSQDKKGYTVMFIDDKKDTGYLMNSEPLSLKKAKEIAGGYRFNARVIPFESGLRLKYLNYSGHPSVRIDSNIFYDNNQPFIEDKGGYLFDTTINKKQEWLIDIPLLIDTGKVVEIWRRKLPDSPRYSTPI